MKKLLLYVAMMLCAGIASAQGFGAMGCQRMVSKQPDGSEKFAWLDHAGCRGNVDFIERRKDDTAIIAIDYAIWGGNKAIIIFYEASDIRHEKPISVTNVTTEKPGMLYLTRKQQQHDSLYVWVRVFGADGIIKYQSAQPFILQTLGTDTQPGKPALTTKHLEGLQSL